MGDSKNLLVESRGTGFRILRINGIAVGAGRPSYMGLLMCDLNPLEGKWFGRLDDFNHLVGRLTQQADCAVFGGQMEQFIYNAHQFGKASTGVRPKPDLVQVNTMGDRAFINTIGQSPARESVEPALPLRPILVDDVLFYGA